MCACVHVPACASARMRRLCVRALDSRQWAAPASDPPERAGVGRHAAYVRGTCPRQRPPSPRTWGRALGALALLARVTNSGTWSVIVQWHRLRREVSVVGAARARPGAEGV